MERAHTWMSCASWGCVRQGGGRSSGSRFAFVGMWGVCRVVASSLGGGGVCALRREAVSVILGGISSRLFASFADIALALRRTGVPGSNAGGRRPSHAAPLRITRATCCARAGCVSPSARDPWRVTPTPPRPERGVPGRTPPSPADPPPLRNTRRPWLTSQPPRGRRGIHIRPTLHLSHNTPHPEGASPGRTPPLARTPPTRGVHVCTATSPAADATSDRRTPVPRKKGTRPTGNVALPHPGHAETHPPKPRGGAGNGRVTHHAPPPPPPAEAVRSSNAK